MNSCPYYLRLSAHSATQMHKSSIKFYRDLSLEYAKLRLKTGTDPLLSGHSVKHTVDQDITPNTPKRGLNYRKDILDLYFKVMLNAKDTQNSIKCILVALKDGWLLTRTWKSIFYSLLGITLTQKIVKIKQKLTL